MDTKTTKPYKVLVVEDDIISLEALVGKLTLEGFRVLTARDGEEGLTAALQKHPDLVLLDIIMPRMDGTTMLKKLRKDPWGSKVPVIILSNITLEGKLDEEIRTQVLDYLMKTQLKLENVVEKIRQALEKQQPS